MPIRFDAVSQNEEAMMERTVGVSLQVIAAAILFGATMGAATAEGVKPDARELTPAERARAERQRELRLQAIRETDTKAIVWGNERRANKTVVFTLDDPLERTTSNDVVEVELFSPGFDDDGTGDVTICAMALALEGWWPTLEKARVPVHLAYRQVDEGPGLDERHRASRRIIAELITGGSIQAKSGNRLGTSLVTNVTDWLRRGGRSESVPGKEIRGVLPMFGIDPARWELETQKEVERARTANNARWSELAGPYARWRGHDPRAKRALGLGAAPIVLIDGRHLITMNTIRKQGGRNAPERLFQTVNSIIQMQLTSHNRVEKETKMNYTAAALAAATTLLASCATSSHDPENPQPWRGGWKVESGKVEILPDAAHLRMKRSGRVLRVIYLEPLEGDEAARARQGVEQLTGDREITCGWPHGWGAKDNPAVMSAEGYPIASCKMGKPAEVRSCNRPSCHLSYRVLSAGYGKYAAGPWEKRTERGKRDLPKIKQAAAEAKRTKKGLWK